MSLFLSLLLNCTINNQQPRLLLSFRRSIAPSSSPCSTDAQILPVTAPVSRCVTLQQKRLSKEHSTVALHSCIVVRSVTWLIESCSVSSTVNVPRSVRRHCLTGFDKQRATSGILYSLNRNPSSHSYQAFMFLSVDRERAAYLFVLF